MKRKVLITGARGFLGRHLAPALEAEGYEVIALGHTEVEITDAVSLARTLEAFAPDILVNCAAISSTAYAAEHPEESLAINVDACVVLAKACAARNIRLFTMSSDQVYAGCTFSGPVPEDIALKPGNTYGLHKYMMEGKVLAECPDAVVLRLPWMFEEYNEERPHTDVVSRFVEAFRSGATLKVSTREFRGMSDVDEVSANIIRAFDVLPGGVYNFGSENMKDSYSTFVSIAGRCGFPVDRIVADSSWGRNISMDCSKLSGFGIRFAGTEDSVCRKLKF